MSDLGKLPLMFEKTLACFSVVVWIEADTCIHFFMPPRWQQLWPGVTEFRGPWMQHLGNTSGEFLSPFAWKFAQRWWTYSGFTSVDKDQCHCDLTTEFWPQLITNSLLVYYSTQMTNKTRSGYMYWLTAVSWGSFRNREQFTEASDLNLENI